MIIFIMHTMAQVLIILYILIKTAIFDDLCHHMQIY